jgi:hypothetical protein
MTQIYPNCQRPDSALGGPAPIQVFRVPYTVTAADHTNQYASIPMLLPVPFADANYSIQMSIEGPNGGGNFYLGAIYGKTANGFVVTAAIVSLATVTTGDKLVIHATVTHD